MFKKDTVLSTTFEEYHIKEQIGQGGNGTVFLAKNSDGQVVALKAINMKKSSLEKAKRFKNEIDFCLKNRNSNIIEVIDHGIHKDGKEEYLFY